MNARAVSWRRRLASVTRGCAVATALLLPACATSPASREENCPVQGAWELESLSVNGEPQRLDEWRQMKLVTATHWAFVGQQTGDVPIATVADSLALLRSISFGGGTYSVVGDRYTERLTYFFHPEMVGEEVTFSCRIDNGRWYHAGQLSDFRLAEVWRRID